MTSQLVNHTTCPHCGCYCGWSWEDAFDKFGFDDGDGIVMTDTVAQTLRDNGYKVEVTPWGLHNVVITGIARDGISLIPEATELGYDDPRNYLPHDIVALLDRSFRNSEVQP